MKAKHLKVSPELLHFPRNWVRLMGEPMPREIADAICDGMAQRLDAEFGGDMTITHNGQTQEITPLDCVRIYFTERGDAALFAEICTSHRGSAWFDDGIRLGYSLAQIYAIAKNAEPDGHLGAVER
jgi:hypothetical protein